jgi:BirA family transcriptional regulator, biotin operon repressor / biotin---[acetyl-CoA-carboxylase] ligase
MSLEFTLSKTSIFLAACFIIAERNNMPEYSLSPEDIMYNLKTSFVGQRIIYYPALASTMDEARKEAQWGAEAGTVVITDEQISGRGRLQRTWISPKGALAFSVILRPNLDYLPCMIMLASLAVSYAIETVTGLKCQIKWPNDVLIQEKKVSGILIETDIRNNALRHVIIGFGINVNMRVADYSEIAAFATSLSDQLGQDTSRLEIVRQVLMEIEKLYQTMSHSDYIWQEWKNRMITLGQKIEVNSGNGTFSGMAESVSKDGSLLIRQNDGKSVKIIVGDVILR